jgi:hypothetical protein
LAASWLGGGLVLTLPCDREAALAALDAAISSARRSVAISAFTAFIFMLILFTFAAMAADSPGPVGVFIVFFALLLAVMPLASYMQVQPWIRYLEELRRGIEEGRIRVEDVCGRPLGPGVAPGWRRP